MTRLTKQSKAGYRRLSVQLGTVTGTQQKRALLELKCDLSEYSSLMKVDTPTSIVPASLLMLTRILESCPLLADAIGRLSGHMEEKKSANGLRTLATRILSLSMGAYKAMGGGRMGLKKFMDELEELEKGRKRSKSDTRNLGRKWCRLYRRSVYEPVYEGLVEVTGVFVEDLFEMAIGVTIPRGPRMAVPNLAGVGGNPHPPYPLFPVGQVGGGVPPPPVPRVLHRPPSSAGGAHPPGFPRQAGTPSRSPSPGPRPDGGGGGVAIVLPPVAATTGAPPSPSGLRRSARLQNVSRSVSPVLEPAVLVDVPLSPAGHRPERGGSTSSSSASYVTAPSRNSDSETGKPASSSVRGSRVRMMDDVEEDLEDRQMELEMGVMRREETPPSRRGRRVSPRLSRDSNGERRESGRMMRKRRREGDDESDSSDDDSGLLRRDKKKAKKVGHSPLPPTTTTATTTTTASTPTPSIAQRLMTPLRGLWSRMSSAPQVLRSSESQDGWDIVVIRRQEREEKQRKEREERQRKRDERQESEERRESEEEMEVDGDDEMEVDEEEKKAEEQ